MFSFPLDFSCFSITIFLQGLQRFNCPYWAAATLVNLTFFTNSKNTKILSCTNYLSPLLFNLQLYLTLIRSFETELQAVLCIEEYSVFLFAREYSIFFEECARIFYITCFHLHRIAARRVRAVTSRLVLFSVDDDWWWRTSYMRSSAFQTIYQARARER